MAYCTYTDITDEIGTGLGTATETIINRRILKSDERIVSTLLEMGVDVAPASDSRLRDASIYLTCAWLKRRQSHELSRPNSLSLGGDISFSTSPESEAAAYEKRGIEMITQYANYTGDSGVIIVPNADDPYLEMR